MHEGGLEAGLTKYGEQSPSPSLISQGVDIIFLQIKCHTLNSQTLRLAIHELPHTGGNRGRTFYSHQNRITGWTAYDHHSPQMAKYDMSHCRY